MQRVVYVVHLHTVLNLWNQVLLKNYLSLFYGCVDCFQKQALSFRCLICSHMYHIEYVQRDIMLSFYSNGKQL